MAWSGQRNLLSLRKVFCWRSTVLPQPRTGHSTVVSVTVMCSLRSSQPNMTWASYRRRIVYDTQLGSSLPHPVQWCESEPILVRCRSFERALNHFPLELIEGGTAIGHAKRARRIPRSDGLLSAGPACGPRRRGRGTAAATWRRVCGARRRGRRKVLAERPLEVSAGAARALLVGVQKDAS